MRELQLIAAHDLQWRERPDPTLQGPRDAIVRPFLAGRCDGDTLPIHRRVSRAMQLGMRAGLIDPVVGSICGPVPFRGPVAIGHECVAEIVELGSDVTDLAVGDVVIVPWAVSCGDCDRCRRGLTAKCARTTNSTLAAYGFGPASGNWGGMVADLIRVPYADHMLVSVPTGLDPLRVAAGSDNLADAWRCVAPGLAARPGGSVLILGGAGQSIALYAVALARALGAGTIDYVDSRPERLSIAEQLGATVHPTRAGKALRLSDIPARDYDIAVEATSSAAGVAAALRSLGPGGHCTPVGYYLPPGTKVPLMHMYANDATLTIGVSHSRALLPPLLELMTHTDVPTELVTTRLGDWDDAPREYATHTTKLVLQRDRIHSPTPAPGR